MSEPAENIISIDDNEINYDELNEQQRYWHQQMLDLRNKQTRIQFELDQVNASFSVFQNLFVGSLQEEEKQQEEE
jgi:hypothetical protein|tara:strand:+ start:770 stop:994 length:225 start_codon:yes stop_codon:yes gene_type:complete